MINILKASLLAKICLGVTILKSGCTNIWPATNEGWVEISTTMLLAFETLEYKTFTAIYSWSTLMYDNHLAVLNTLPFFHNPSLNCPYCSITGLCRRANIGHSINHSHLLKHFVWTNVLLSICMAKLTRNCPITGRYQEHWITAEKIRQTATKWKLITSTIINDFD